MAKTRLDNEVSGISLTDTAEEATPDTGKLFLIQTSEIRKTGMPQYLHKTVWHHFESAGEVPALQRPPSALTLFMVVVVVCLKHFRLPDDFTSRKPTHLKEGAVFGAITSNTAP